MNAWKIIVLAASFLAAIMAAAGAKELFAEAKRPSTFVLGTRYGRAGDSGEARLRIQKSSSEKFVKPRKDSFYIPRYGKRSSNSLTYPLSGSVLSSGGTDDLTCIYSGVGDLYRCVHRIVARDEEISAD